MAAEHIFHHKDADGFRVEYDLCLTVETGTACFEQPKTLMNQDEYEAFQKKTDEFLDNYSEAVEEIEKLTCQADGYDYAIAVSSGIIAGLIDLFFVGKWDFKNAKKISNIAINNIIIEFAKKDPRYIPWCNGVGKTAKWTRRDPNRLASAVSFLEEKYVLPGDNAWKFTGSGVSAASHHLDDFCHHPTLIGMICCILVQFTGNAKYHPAAGDVIKLPVTVNEYGNFVSEKVFGKVFAGIINWFFKAAQTLKNQKGHLMSDMAGSISAVKGMKSGAGIPGTIMSTLKELSALPCFKDTSFAVNLRRAYQNGIGSGPSQLDLGIFNNLFDGASSKFDMRTEMAVKHELKKQAVPVVINEIVVRSFYFIRRFIEQMKVKQSLKEIEWKKLLPMNNRTIVRMMVISTGTMEVVDMADAAIRAMAKSGLNPYLFATQFVLRINYIGICRFSIACAVDVAMGMKKDRLELAIASAEVAIVAKEEIKVIDKIHAIQEKTNEHLKQVGTQVDSVYNMINYEVERHMDKDYNSIQVDQDIFTIDDAIEAAKQLFEVQANDFYALKNEKWYKDLLNAITFGSDRKKKVIRDIKTLSKLQTIFMRVYCENYKDLDLQLNEIINNIAKTNQSVKKIYNKYCVGVEPQQSILELHQFEQDILLLLLCSYKSMNGNEENLKKFRSGVAQTIGRGIPQGEFKPEMLEQIRSDKILYRIIVEMCAIDGGLHDFSVPDNISEAINYLSVSGIEKERIKSQIVRELDSLGVDYLITKYGIAEEELIDDDIEFELKDENTVNEDFATIIIDEDLQIPHGEQKIYKNKDLFIHADVICEGELLFDNCRLKYNDSALSGKIRIKETGQLSITDCTIECLSYKDDYFFECNGNVNIKHTKFSDCSYLFKASKDFFVNECEIYDCATNLFYLRADRDTKITICNNKIIQRDLQRFYTEDLDERVRLHAMIWVSSLNPRCNANQFHNNIFAEEPGFTHIFKDKHTKFNYISAYGMSISQSSFINTSGYIEIDASNISECYFKGCYKPIVSKLLGNNIEIDNCIFYECEDVISCTSNSEVKNCQFVSCKNRLIDCGYAFDGGVRVYSCIFKNIHNDFDGDDSYLPGAYKASAICFCRCKNTSSKLNIITNCSFDGVAMKKAFLIAPDGFERPWEDTVVKVDNCKFSHCVSERKSKKLIGEYFSYYGLFNKERIVHATNIYCCEGLDKTNSEGSRADNLSINFISTYGRKIGSNFTL